MKEWVKCLLCAVGMGVAYILIRLSVYGTLEPWGTTWVTALCGCLPGVGVYYGDRLRRKNKENKDKINQYLNKKNNGF